MIEMSTPLPTIVQRPAWELLTCRPLQNSHNKKTACFGNRESPLAINSYFSHFHFQKKPCNPQLKSMRSARNVIHAMASHSHSRRRNRSKSSSTERSRGRIPLRQRSRETHLRRSRSRDRHSRHRHEYTSRPSRDSRHSSHDYTSRTRTNYPSETRNESPTVRYDRLSPLLLYRHFINALDVNILPEEAHSRYKPYLHQLKKGFFAAHKDDQRLKDMYHPFHIESAINKRNKYANSVAKSFFKDLENGTLMLLECGSPGNAVRHLKDLNQARCLIAKVDAEKDIHENLLLSSGEDGSFAQFVPVKNTDGRIRTLGGIELLNVVITYLWDVHGIHYYGMTEIGKDLITREGKNLAAAEVEQKLDSVWQKRLQAMDPLLVFLGKDKLEYLVNRKLCAHFTRVGKARTDGQIKYVCKENSCGKCCTSSRDIITHIHDEHSGIVEGYRVRARENIYLENYMNDPFAPCTVN